MDMAEYGVFNNQVIMEMIRQLTEQYPDIFTMNFDNCNLLPSYGNVELMTRNQIINDIRSIGDVMEDEMISALIPHTIRFVTNRGVSHELVRHRPCSFCVSGNTLIRSMAQKKWTVKELYDWQFDTKRKGRLGLMKIRSVDELTNVIVPNTIKEIINTGVKDCYKVTTQSGRKLICTNEHKIYTPKGYIELKKLSIGDCVYSNGIELLENKDWLEDYYLIQNHTRKETAEFIGCCESLVYKSFKKFNIVKSHKDFPNRKPGHGIKGMFSEDMKKHLSDIHKGNKNPAWIENRDQITITAGYSESNRNYIPDKCEICGTKTSLERHHINKNPKDNNRENIMFLCSKCHHLWHHPGAIGVFKDPIISIEYVGKEEVYDIVMNEPYHNFVADGIVVHNCQESQRYVGYDKEKFGSEITVIKPLLEEDTREYELWKYSMEWAETVYMQLRGLNVLPQIARGVLPNDCKTEICVTATEEEWQHIVNLRFRGTAGTPHPQIQQLIGLAYPILVEESEGRIK
jgi:thymidylate synthase (FAD)